MMADTPLSELPGLNEQEKKIGECLQGHSHSRLVQETSCPVGFCKWQASELLRALSEARVLAENVGDESRYFRKRAEAAEAQWDAAVELLRDSPTTAKRTRRVEALEALALVVKDHLEGGSQHSHCAYGYCNLRPALAAVAETEKADD